MPFMAHITRSRSLPPSVSPSADALSMRDRETSDGLQLGYLLGWTWAKGDNSWLAGALGKDSVGLGCVVHCCVSLHGSVKCLEWSHHSYRAWWTEECWNLVQGEFFSPECLLFPSGIPPCPAWWLISAASTGALRHIGFTC